jgi:hypothetical protein
MLFLSILCGVMVFLFGWSGPPRDFAIGDVADTILVGPVNPGKYEDEGDDRKHRIDHRLALQLERASLCCSMGV